MISCHLNKKNSTNHANNSSNSSVLGLNLHQKTISSFWGNKNVLLKRPQAIEIQKPKTHKAVAQVNDENCSFNANTIKDENLKNEDLIKKQNSIFLRFQTNRSESTQQDESSKVTKTNQVINLKKKIKKCSSHQMSRNQSYFREKVSFIRKKYFVKNLEKDQDQQEKKQLQNQQTQKSIQTYPVYRDSEVFSGYRSEQFRNKIVPQRMDNDTQTDDEQIEKFVKRIRTDLVANFQKVVKEKENAKRGDSIQKMEDTIRLNNEE